MTLYTLKHITRRYDNRTILAIDHLDIEDGCIHALLGPNGAGKTTLLDILAFLAPPGSGEIFFRGKPVVYSENSLGMLRRQVVLVDQYPIMFSTSVSGNIEYGLKIRKIGKAERRQTVERVLETVGLQRYRSSAAHKLSGGETRRLAIARALALEPSVLLCDEPTASVDSENQEAIETLLKRINGEFKTSILFTTHDRRQAAALAQRTLVLENGRLADTSVENSFPATLTSAGGNIFRCCLNGRVTFDLPAGELFSKERGSVRIHIDPEKIMFRRPGAEATIGRDIPGIVMLTMAEGGKIRMVVDAGVSMTIRMERACYDQTRPSVGEAVLLRVDPEACTFGN